VPPRPTTKRERNQPLNEGRAVPLPELDLPSATAVVIVEQDPNVWPGLAS
jgi:hypothetical protein